MKKMYEKQTCKHFKIRKPKIKKFKSKLTFVFTT